MPMTRESCFLLPAAVLLDARGLILELSVETLLADIMCPNYNNRLTQIFRVLIIGLSVSITDQLAQCMKTSNRGLLLLHGGLNRTGIIYVQQSLCQQSLAALHLFNCAFQSGGGLHSQPALAGPTWGPMKWMPRVACGRVSEI
jgi:hypothetical protein